MKIIKIESSLKEDLNIPLTEADEEVSVETVTKGGNEETTIIAPVDKAGEPVSNKVALKIKNALTEVLDDALETALNARRKAARFGRRQDSNANVLVIGLPGSSKTATTSGWADANNVYLHYLDSKSGDLDMLINGAPTINKNDPAHPFVERAFSNALDPLDHHDGYDYSVLFLDELNRQVKVYLRGSLLTLVADHKVSGVAKETGPDGKERLTHGYHTFDTMLFTIACINPATRLDQGMVELDDAERRRFGYVVNFDSTIKAAAEWFTASYDSDLKYAATIEKDKSLKNKDYWKDLEEQIYVQDFAEFIVNNGAHTTSFAFNDAKDAKNNPDHQTLLSQANLSEMVNDSHGDPRRFKQLAAKRNFLPATKSMLDNIANEYVKPDLLQLIIAKEKRLRIDLGSNYLAELRGIKTPVNTNDKVKDSGAVEQDANDFGSGSGDIIKDTVSDTEAEERVNNVFDNFGF